MPLTRSGIEPAAAVALAALVLAGCSEPREGQAQPVDGTSSTPDNPASQQLPHSGAPAVNNPLDTSYFQENSCEALTSDQVARLGLDAEGEAETAGAGPVCHWNNTKAGSGAGVYFLTKYDEGLSQLYASQDNLEFFYAMEPVQSFPIAAYAPSDSRDLGSCATMVGVTDRLAIDISASLSRDKAGKEDPCAAARRVADMAITTMEGGG